MNLSPEQLQNKKLVHETVRNLIKLGEQRWRYRIVNEGQSPYTAAKELLGKATGYIQAGDGDWGGELGAGGRGGKGRLGEGQLSDWRGGARKRAGEGGRELSMWKDREGREGEREIFQNELSDWRGMEERVERR